MPFSTHVQLIDFNKKKQSKEKISQKKIRENPFFGKREGENLHVKTQTKEHTTVGPCNVLYEQH